MNDFIENMCYDLYLIDDPDIFLENFFYIFSQNKSFDTFKTLYAFKFVSYDIFIRHILK